MAYVKKNIQFLFLVFFCQILVIFMGFSCESPKNEPLKKKNLVHTRYSTYQNIMIIDSSRLDCAIQTIRQLLNTINREDGQFIYLLNIDDEKTSSIRYNILRHCGVMYALAEIQKHNPDAKTKETLRKSSLYLKSYLKPIKTMLAVSSSPIKNATKESPTSKLGASGLGLVAMAMTRQIGISTFSIDTMEQVAEFLNFMQKQDGSFYSKYHEEKDEQDDSWTSLYYPGEAALGWLMLYELDSSLRWIEYADNALIYLAQSRKNATEIPADHWALIAMAKLFSLKPTMEESKKRMHLCHAIQIVTSIIAQQRTDPTLPPKHFGCFDPTVRTAPAATRIEGLEAALFILPENELVLKKKTISCIQNGIIFLLNSQIQTGKFAGAIPRSATLLDGDSKTIKKLNKRANEIRIDYMQHALSAMLHYRQFCFFDSSVYAGKQPNN